MNGTVQVSVRNTGTDSAVFKLVLAAQPHLKASHFLVPGISYDGNPYGENMPQGWEYKGEPWIYAYDRGSIPSCTISENDDEVFALFVSDADTASMVSSCSMEKLPDGSFRHLIYWPVTEAPLAQLRLCRSVPGRLKKTPARDTLKADDAGGLPAGQSLPELVPPS